MTGLGGYRSTLSRHAKGEIPGLCSASHGMTCCCGFGGRRHRIPPAGPNKKVPPAWSPPRRPRAHTAGLQNRGSHDVRQTNMNREMALPRTSSVRWRGCTTKLPSRGEPGASCCAIPYSSAAWIRFRCRRSMTDAEFSACAPTFRRATAHRPAMLSGIPASSGAGFASA